MSRLLSLVTQMFVFWLPMAIALLMLVLAVAQGSLGMGILAVVVVLVAGLYKVAMTGAAKGRQ